MEIAEFILKIIMIGTLSFGVLGFIVQSTVFEGDLEMYDNTRLAYDFSRAAMAAPCLAEINGGEVERGVLNSTKLDEAYRNPVSQFCLKLEGKKIRITVTDIEGKKWEIGEENIKRSSDTNLFMVAIKYTDKIVPGMIKVDIDEA